MINLFREYFLGENIFFLRTFFKEFFFFNFIYHFFLVNFFIVGFFLLEKFFFIMKSVSRKKNLG